MAKLMADVKALVNRPSVISTATLQELGGQANKQEKVVFPLPEASSVTWESPVCGRRSPTPALSC